MSVEKWLIPDTQMDDMVMKYRAGMPIPKLQAFYGIPYYILKNRLSNYKINVHDQLSVDLGTIQSAERNLITGVFPNYSFNFKIKDQKSRNKYKSLLMYYAKADLNSKHVHITNSLLIKE